MSNLSRKTNAGLEARAARRLLRIGCMAAFYGIAPPPRRKIKAANPVRREGNKVDGYTWYQRGAASKWHKL